MKKIYKPILQTNKYKFDLSYLILPECPLELVVVDQGAAVIRNPQLEPIGGSRQLSHAPLAPVLESVDVDIDVVTPGSKTWSPGVLIIKTHLSALFWTCAKPRMWSSS